MRRSGNRSVGFVDGLGWNGLSNKATQVKGKHACILVASQQSDCEAPATVGEL